MKIKGRYIGNQMVHDISKGDKKITLGQGDLLPLAEYCISMTKPQYWWQPAHIKSWFNFMGLDLDKLTSRMKQDEEVG